MGVHMLSLNPAIPHPAMLTRPRVRRRGMATWLSCGLRAWWILKCCQRFGRRFQYDLADVKPRQVSTWGNNRLASAWHKTLIGKPAVPLLNPDPTPPRLRCFSPCGDVFVAKFAHLRWGSNKTLHQHRSSLYVSYIQVRNINLSRSCLRKILHSINIAIDNDCIRTGTP